MFEKKTGRIIKEWRNQLGLTGEQLGEKVFPDEKKPQSLISKIEKGKRKLKFEEACLLVDFFGKSLNDLHPYFLPKIKNADDEIFLKLHAIFNYDRKTPGIILKGIIELFYNSMKEETLGRMKRKEKENAS